jgi:hypothetical protein
MNQEIADKLINKIDELENLILKVVKETETLQAYLKSKRSPFSFIVHNVNEQSTKIL